MKLFNTYSICALLVSMAAVATPSAGAAAPTLELNYGGQTPCIFNTTSGVSVVGSQAGVISANGVFGSGCPSGGGATGPAALTLTAAPAGVDVNDSAVVTWSATADVCHYDGTSLPQVLAGWPNASGDACVGASDCAVTHNYNATFASSGTYTFGLKCYSGAHGVQNQTSVAKTAVVTVDGGTPPPSTTCVAPSGLTRQMTGTLQDFTGLKNLSNTDMTQWSEVFGIDWQTYKRYAWPGLAGTGSKMFVNKDRYLSLAFTVPANFPIYNPATFKPSGGFLTNWSAVTNNVDWAVSISEDCGDFMQPASSNPDYKCYANYNTNQGSTLNWVVSLENARVAGTCNLTRGHTYYFNIIAAPLNNPTQSNCPGGSGSVCKVNFQNKGLFVNGALLP